MDPRQWTPGQLIQINRRLDLPAGLAAEWQAWLPAEAAVVKTSAAWTLAEAVAGGTPNANSTEDEMTP